MSVQPPEASLRVCDVGEFGLIQRLQTHIESHLQSNDAALEPGIGDDAAAWQPGDGARQVITADALIQDVHFRLSTTSWRDLGWKSLAVNVSDLAAMGSAPRFALITLGLPGHTHLNDILELYDGIMELAAELRVAIAGGDVVSSPLIMISVTAIGESTGQLLRRDVGRPGDSLAVTGCLGGSAGGLRLLETQAGEGAGSPGCGAARDRLVQAHLRPRPRVAEGKALIEAGVRCGLDLSDGLLGDAAHICERSGVGAVIDASLVPVDAALRQLYAQEAQEMAMTGGEDYELLCAGSPGAINQAQAALANLGTPLTVVGRLTKRPADGRLVRLLDASGQEVRLGTTSWDHFGEPSS